VDNQVKSVDNSVFLWISRRIQAIIILRNGENEMDSAERNVHKMGIIHKISDIYRPAGITGWFPGFIHTNLCINPR
jgi:hypothetical protein